MKESERLRIFAEKMIEAWSIWLEEEEDMSRMQVMNKEKSMDIETVRNLMTRKVHEGKSEKIREILQLFRVEKLSDLSESDYEEFVNKVEQI